MFRNASQLQFGFIRFFFFFFSPSLEGWYEFISSSRKFYVYESAILKIFKRQCTCLNTIVYMLSLYYAGNPKSVKFSCKDFSSSLLAENVMPSNFSSHLSPLGGTLKKSGMCCKVAFLFFFFFFKWYASD